MRNLIVHDNFYQNPEAVRDVALKCEYSDVRSLNYPGFQSVRCFSNAGLIGNFSEIVGENLDVRPEALTFGRFRIMLATSHSHLKVHVDDGADWSGLIYLNPDTQCAGGTAFYRHRRTGLYAPPPTRSDGAPESFSTTSTRKILEDDTLDESAWERVMFVAMKFNRLILFRGSRLFHSHTHGFGHSTSDGRLTQNFFFNASKEEPCAQQGLRELHQVTA